MLNLASILVGLVALAVALVGFFPLLGWINWLALPIAAVGAAIGTLSSHSGGRNLNLLVMGLGAARLFIGGGIL